MGLLAEIFPLNRPMGLLTDGPILRKPRYMDPKGNGTTIPGSHRGSAQGPIPLRYIYHQALDVKISYHNICQADQIYTKSYRQQMSFGITWLHLNAIILIII